MASPENYTGLCLSSGGVKGLSQLGALTIFEMNGYLKDVKSYAGCSIGSIISLLLACGWKPLELYRRAVKIKLFNGMSDISIETLKTKHGLISNDLLRQELETLVIEKKGKLPTFLDFHNEGIYLGFSICDRRSKTGKKLDYLSYPLLSVSEAALMSSNMPVIFPPMEFDGMKIVDGALSNPFPIDYLDNQRDKILGISVYGDDGDESLFNALSGYLMMPIEEIQRRITIQASSKVDILEMTVKDISVMDLQASFDAKDDMFFTGLENAKLMARVLDKKRRRERRHKHKVNPPSQNKVNETNPPDRKPSDRRPPKNMVRVALKAIPEEVLVKCLLSQPIDILLLAALNHREVLQASFKHLSLTKANHLKLFAKQILVNEEPVKYSRRRHETPVRTESPRNSQDDDIPFTSHNVDKGKSGPNENAEPDYGPSYKVRVKENHSQKIFERLPTRMKEMAKVVFSSLTPEQSNKTVSGINIIVEGLNRLGINIFNGLLLEGSMSSDESSAVGSPREVVTGRVEIVADDDFGVNPDGTPKRSSDNID